MHANSVSVYVGRLFLLSQWNEDIKWWAMRPQTSWWWFKKNKQKKPKSKPWPLYFNPNRSRHTKPRLAGALWYQWLPTTDSLSLQLPGCWPHTTPCGFPLTHRRSPSRPAATQPAPSHPLALLFGRHGHHSDSLLWNPNSGPVGSSSPVSFTFLDG